MINCCSIRHRLLRTDALRQDDVTCLSFFNFIGRGMDDFLKPEPRTPTYDDAQALEEFMQSMPPNFVHAASAPPAAPVIRPTPTATDNPHPVVGLKSPRPPSVSPPPRRAVMARKSLPDLDVQQPSSSDESSSSSGSDMDVEDEAPRAPIKKERKNKRPRSPSPAAPTVLKKKIHRDHPTPAAKNTQLMERDAKLVAPLPFVQFLQQRQTPKACGRCLPCKQPPCGVCKACVQNAKTDSKEPKDRRRCEALRCEKDLFDAAAAMPAGVPEDKDKLSDELLKVSGALAELSSHRGRPDFDQKRYEELIARTRALRDGQLILKNRKARRRVKFPVGFHDVWGVISSLEKDRLKFAKFIIRTASSEECRTIDMKRRMRDDLEMMQLDIARKHSPMLCPFEEKETFLATIEQGRF